MASNYTENYGLCQWEATDQVLRTDFNSDNSKIDEALKSHTNSIFSLSSQMSGKASANTVSSLSSQMSKKGNCEIFHTTYTGNGGTSKTLTFSGKPLLVVIMQKNVLWVAVQGVPAAMARNGGIGGSTPTLTWSGNSVSWPCGAEDELHCNRTGVTYYVTAVMEA